MNLGFGFQDRPVASTTWCVSSLNYTSAGVDYGPLDAFKRACQREAGTTTGALAHHGFKEPDSVRGESAYLIETPDGFLAHVEEGLGSKNLIADAMARLTGACYYRSIGIDTVATIVNDLITCGALPVSVAMHAAVGAGSWFEDQHRAAELAAGFAEACRASGAVWGGGETPALKGIVNEEAIVLAGSAIGMIRGKSRRVVPRIEPGDAIVMLASSGVQTNGLTLCRVAADRLPQGYLTRLSDGRTYGEALLAPSVIYVDFLKHAQGDGLDLHYLAHITGHGWRKLMRADQPIEHVITDVPPVPPDIALLIEQKLIEKREAYATFNMGAGFAAWVKSSDAGRAVEIAKQAGYEAWIAGHAEASKLGRRAVVIPSLDLRFESDELQLK